ncbi:hypothetical protein JTE90_019730 [Oedothorax gibbosus]|uniref:Uncharacterized protein n=1 Tax=Oedothorax gibbosus TaxID=931172 RepID=A0AAV6UPE9_9ARAC|nr:hypothetical protein JTE90_019730 [Oedothorax gibbosus]
MNHIALGGKDRVVKKRKRPHNQLMIINKHTQMSPGVNPRGGGGMEVGLAKCWLSWHSETSLRRPLRVVHTQPIQARGRKKSRRGEGGAADNLFSVGRAIWFRVEELRWLFFSPPRKVRGKSYKTGRKRANRFRAR